LEISGGLTNTAIQLVVKVALTRSDFFEMKFGFEVRDEFINVDLVRLGGGIIQNCVTVHSIDATKRMLPAI